MLDEGPQFEPNDVGHVLLVRAGAHATGAFHCTTCGYGVTVHETLPACPMCAGATWEPEAPGAFAGSATPL